MPGSDRMNEELAVKNLKALKEVFDKFGITFWLDGGTLLGAVRDGKLIEWDKDVDLSIWEYDREKLFSALHELKARNRFFVYPLYPNTGAVTLWLFPFDCPIDILLWKVKADKLTNLTPSYEDSNQPINPIISFSRILIHYLFSDLSVIMQTNRAQKKVNKIIVKILESSLPSVPLTIKRPLIRILQRRMNGPKWFFITPKHFFEELTTVMFYGEQFRIPFDFKGYLQYHYGEWKRPLKDWNYWKNDYAPPIKE
jgi:hypothetical protein